MIERNIIIGLNNALDGFLQLFAELSPEEQVDYIHENSFLDTIYSKGWDDASQSYRGDDAEVDEGHIVVDNEYVGSEYCTHCSRWVPYKAHNIQTEWINPQPSSDYEEEFEYIICPNCGKKIYFGSLISFS